LEVSVQNSTQLDGSNDFYVLVFGVVYLRFLTANQKQQCVNVCEELRQIASDDAAFLSRVITCDGWTYSSGLDIQQQSSQWKIRTNSIASSTFSLDISQIILNGRPNSELILV
jgi:hypothetical protein